ncbi:AB hydrolase superfamily protein YdjP [Burkholderiales bacterium]|nr:AB hydrolase superfamily protein YdjP [Burkholderiales bacterium]
MAFVGSMAGDPSPAHAAQGRAASADGVAIAYDAHGAGTPALVFVHGWSCDRTYWKGQLEPLGRRYRVVAIDLAGHGESGTNRQAWTIAAFGADVAAVVEKLGIERVILIGHSMGGDVIVEAARRLRGRVAGLVWVDVYRKLDAPPTAERIEAFVAPFRVDFTERTRAFVRGMFPATADKSLVEWIAADMSSAPKEIALAAMVSVFSNGREMPAALADLKLPTIAINPDHPPTDFESLKRHGVEVVLMPGVGHFPMMEDPERFNRVLGSVIEKLPR